MHGYMNVKYDDKSLQTDRCHKVTLNLSTTYVERARRGQTDKEGPRETKHVESQHVN